MQYRQFGSTSLMVSEIGFGAWAIGGGNMIGSTAIGWGDADDSVSIKAIQSAVDQGINFFDTADIYGLGHSETLLGKTIGNNKEMIIATKAGNVSRAEKFTVDYSKEHLLKACEQSLIRLKRETIDYYQLHTARMPDLLAAECITAMQLLQQQGKIRYWGLSLNTFDPLPEAGLMLQNNWGNGFQLVLNILNQRALPVLKNASEKGYGIIARMPLQFGLLTGKFDKGFSFAENDHRKSRLTAEVISACSQSLLPVWKLCKKYNCTKTQLALSYIRSYLQVSVIIPGIRTAEQVQANTNGLFQLENEDLQTIEKLGTSDFETLVQLIQKQG
jgi:aryl-alcohol dehydrogenase-like predicted oxidoreductase